MKIGNKSITGILSFVIGVEYEHKDIILINGDLYIVTKSEGFISTSINQVTDGSLGFCTPYFEYLSYDINHPNDRPNGPINIASFRSLLNQVIDGISDLGIQDYDLRTDSELDALTTTAIYRIRFTDSVNPGVGLKTDKYYIYRCYATDNEVSQEIVDFEDGDILLRHFDGIQWTSNWLPSGYTSNEIVEYLYSFQSKLAHYANWIETIVGTGYTWYSLPVNDPYENRYESLTNATLIEVILITQVDDDLYQSVQKLVTLNYFGTTEFPDTDYILKVSNSSNIVDVVLESDDYTIQAILANKPLKSMNNGEIPEYVLE